MKRPLFLFYILVIYVFASFSWWAYLLLEKNSASFNERILLEKIKYNHRYSLPEVDEAFFKTPDYITISKHYERQKWMIMSEGLVFIILLALGSWRLRQSFNKEIELARQQNNFLLSITHELKSPLASVKLSLQTLLKRITMEDKYRKLAENSVEDVDRLSGLVDNILYAARMEDSTFELHREIENISELTKELLHKVETVHKEHLTLRNGIQPDILLETDRMAFISAVLNLVENAIKYSPQQAEVEVSLKKNDGIIALEVKDNGIGIPENERANVFKKFYRAGNEETRNTKGTGLGLFIVKKVVDLHKGKITMKENEPNGTVVRIELPG